MNGVKNELHVRVEQTARGIWYCSGADVYAENHLEMATELDLVMGKIEDILAVHNRQNDDEKQHTDLTTANTTQERMKKVAK